MCGVWVWAREGKGVSFSSPSLYPKDEHPEKLLYLEIVKKMMNLPIVVLITYQRINKSY